MVLRALPLLHVNISVINMGFDFGAHIHFTDAKEQQASHTVHHMKFVA